MDNLSDHYLLGKIKAGDVSSFEKLVDRHKSYAYTIAYRVVGSHEDAEEIANDAFVKLFSIADSFKGDSKFTTWFYRIVVNTAIGRMRKKKIRTEDITDPANSTGYNMAGEEDQSLQTKDRKYYLELAIQKLSDEERILITLYYFKELSLSEMTKITDLDANSMKVKIFRARKKLAKTLEVLLPNEVASIY